MKLHIDRNVQPVAQPARKMPFKMREQVKNKLDELLIDKQDIIEKIEGPTSWLSPQVVVPKPNNDIRICLDMRQANTAVLGGRFPLPNIDETLEEMNGAKALSKLDLRQGLYQVEIEPSSRDITNFVTYDRIYRLRRLNFGISCAPEIYQRIIQQTLSSIQHTTLPHNLIKDKLVDLIERTFQREGSLYIACNDRNAFFTSDAVRNYNLWSCQKVCEALTFLLDNIYIRFGSKLYRQIVGIPMGTNCAPLVADLFLFCYERDFMLSLSEENQSGIIEAFNSTSRYLDDLLNIDNNFFDSMVNRIYPSELQLNKANVSDAEASFLDLHLSISDGFVKTKIYDKRDDFDFDIVNFPFLDGDVPRSASYGVYISQLIRFARVSSHVDDFNTRNKVLTAKLLRQGYRYHKLRKAFSKFYRRHFDIVSKYNVGLKTLLLQGLSEPEFYGDLVYKFRKIIGKIDFPYHFKKIIVRYKKIGYNINVMRQTACLVVNPIKVNSFAYLFNCTTVGRTSD